MAYLLGASAVMESLQRDVRDVQGCVTDIISRVGPVRSTSWKFPDKLAADLDIEDLLDLYSYSDDEEERQVAHIALYELVIDRLVLLLHTMAAYTDGTLKMVRSDDSPSQQTGTSVGVVVKKYWSRLSHLNTAVKDTVKEKNAMTRQMSELESDVSRLNLDLKQSSQTNRPKTAGFGGLIPPNRAEMMTGLSLNPSQLRDFGLLGKDEYNKGCQTNETAFTPCDSCSIVQRSFRQSGELVVSICQQQQIPSCLQKFRPQVSHLDWLSGNDVSRWASEQNKDLQRISKLTATIKPLQTELSQCRDHSDKLETRVANFDRDLKREKDERTMLHKQYEIKIQDLKDQHERTMELEKQQKDLLQMNKEEMQKLLDKHKAQLVEQQELLKELESTKTKMADELSNKKVNEAEVQKFEAELSALQGKLTDVTTKMEVSSKELHKEQAKNKSVSKHTQSLQSKQESLLKRITDLDEENRELREQVSELEEEKDTYDEKMGDSTRETTVLQRKLKEKEGEIEQVLADKESLEQTIVTLETSVQRMTDQLEGARERERLIVEYPDVNGPVNPDMIGTGDILVDMENQVKANNIRIQLLESQNEGLRNSITKLMTMQRQQQQQQQQHWEGEEDTERTANNTQWATHVKTHKPTPLWRTDYAETKMEDLERVEPEHSHMEYKYNKSSTHLPSDHHSNTPSRISSASKSKYQPGIHNIELDTSQRKTPPKKDRPPFGNRPLTGKSGRKTSDEFIVGKSARPESAKVKRETSAGKSRPTSAKAPMVPMNTSSISAYLQMKKSGKLNMLPNQPSAGGKHEGLRPATGNHHIPTDSTTDRSYIRQDSFICPNCDKMYTRQRDLDIHQSYCVV